MVNSGVIMGDPRTLAMHLNLTQQILERIQSCKYKTIMRTMGVDQGELIAPAFPPCGEQLRVGCFFRLNIELVSVGRVGLRVTLLCAQVCASISPTRSPRASVAITSTYSTGTRDPCGTSPMARPCERTADARKLPPVLARAHAPCSPAAYCLLLRS